LHLAVELLTTEPGHVEKQGQTSLAAAFHFNEGKVQIREVDDGKHGHAATKIYQKY
jgi:hypothetical protein